MKPAGVRLTVSVLLALLTTGCGARTVLVVDPTDMDELNRAARGKTVTITIIDNTRTSAKDVLVTPELTSWIDAKEGKRDTVSTTMIKSISVRQAARGAGRGFLTGAVIGVVFSGITYSSNQHEPYREAYFLFFPALFGLVGMLGGAATCDDLYDFAPLSPWEPALDLPDLKPWE